MTDKPTPPPKKTGFMTLQWFEPVWRRALLLVFIAGWFTWELLYTHDQMWVTVTVIMFAYAVWYFFINFEKALKKAKDDAKPQA